MNTGGELSNNCLTMMRVLYENGPTTRTDLRGMLPSMDVDSTLGTLRWHELIEGQRGQRVAIYELTGKGMRLARPQSGSGVIAAPRMPVSADTYKGERAITTRPGAMDAYHRPSRRGDNYLPHARPISLASRVQDTKFR